MTKLARLKIDVLMPSYTHLQAAQIIRFSHWLINHCEALRQSWSRFGNIDSIHWCPLGSFRVFFLNQKP